METILAQTVVNGLMVGMIYVLMATVLAFKPRGLFPAHG